LDRCVLSIPVRSESIARLMWRASRLKRIALACGLTL
jgi:hypothetical protein